MLVIYFIFLQIAVGWWLIQYLLSHERGPKEPKWALITAGGFGVLAVIAGLFLEKWLISPKLLQDVVVRQHHLSLSFLLTNCLLIGVIEESVKALPLSIFIYRKKYFDEMTDGIIYFGIAGMVFGVLESISYTLHLGIAAGLGKIITGPFSHASFSAMIGYGIARHKILHKKAWTIIPWVLLAMGLHGLYDFGLFAGHWWIASSLTITLGINLLIFWLFARAKRHDERLGLSAIGDNLYCRHCGFPNRRHYLYCLRCGQKT